MPIYNQCSIKRADDDHARNHDTNVHVHEGDLCHDYDLFPGLCHALYTVNLSIHHTFCVRIFLFYHHLSYHLLFAWFLYRYLVDVVVCQGFCLHASHFFHSLFSPPLCCLCCFVSFVLFVSVHRFGPSGVLRLLFCILLLFLLTILFCFFFIRIFFFGFLFIRGDDIRAKMKIRAVA